MPRQNLLGDPNLYPLHQVAKLVLESQWQLPHFQRPYVWSKEQQVALFRSLIEEFPISALLLWKWKKQKGPSVPFDLSIDRTDTGRATFLVIDGQQRLTTISRQYLMSRMSIGEWRQFDGRSSGVIEVDLKSPTPAATLRLLIPRKAAERDSYVTNDGKVLLPGLLRDDYERCVMHHLRGKRERQRAEDVRRRLRERIVLVDTLPPAANIDQAIEAFERINSEGTRLGVVDIAAAQVFFAAPKLSAAIKKAQQTLVGTGRNSAQFRVFTIDLLIRGLLFELYGQANPSVILKFDRSKLPKKAKVERAWKRTLRSFEDLREFLVADLKMLDSSPLQSAKLAALVASRAFVGRTLSAEDRNRLKRWLVLACVFKPYSGTSTNPSVDKDMHSMSGSRSIAWEALDRTIQDNARGGSSLKLTEEHLSPADEPLPRKHILHQLTWLLAHNHGALDWITATPIPPVHPESPSSLWDRHHIFPRSYMREEEMSEHANRIGNLAWLSRTSNRKHIRDRLPTDYLRRVRHAEFGLSALKAQAVPDSPTLYGDALAFIRQRESLLARELNSMLEEWGSGNSGRFEVISRAKRTVQEIIEQGDESHPIEFKSSFFVEPSSGEMNPKLSHAALKAIASLANSGGGILLVGVADDGAVLGIESETRFLCERARSGRAELARLVNDYAKKQTFPKGKDSVAQTDFLKLELEACRGKKVLVARVYQAPAPIWMRQLPPDATGGNRGPWVVWCRDGASTASKHESRLAEPPAFVEMG
jgi:hypothetical protein